MLFSNFYFWISFLPDLITADISLEISIDLWKVRGTVIFTYLEVSPLQNITCQNIGLKHALFSVNYVNTFGRTDCLLVYLLLKDSTIVSILLVKHTVYQQRPQSNIARNFFCLVQYMWLLLIMNYVHYHIGFRTGVGFGKEVIIVQQNLI